LDQADQYSNDGQDQQDVNEPTQRVRANHAQQPEDQKQNGYSPKHWHSFRASGMRANNCCEVYADEVGAGIE
jgi:hypothetical protein